MGKKTIVSLTYENGRISIKNSLPYLKCVASLLRDLSILSSFGPDVRMVDKAIRWINLYPLDNAIDVHNTYPQDSDLFSG